MSVLVLGATSRIALQIARDYAALGEGVFVAARDGDEAKRIASDLHLRYGVAVGSASFDARDYAAHPVLVANAAEVMGGIEIGIVAFGEMGDQAASEGDFPQALAVLEVNYVGAVSVCESLAKLMSARGRGSIIGITSVSGDRGRPSNYFYGSAKGGFSLYLQGLRARMYRAGVHVMTVKLGFIDTPMTYGMKTRIPIASPEAASRAVIRAQHKRNDTLYYPAFWRCVMFAIKAVPERIFKRLHI